jgi:hypothetical protein
MTLAVNLAQGASNNVTFRNKIINGAILVWQRGTTFNTPADGDYNADRWQYGANQSGKVNIAQSSSAPSGFSYSALVTSTSSYSVGSTDLFRYTQRIEGFNTADLAFGTASASTVTLSFWVRSSLTGTFGGSLQNNNGDRSYPFTYTISSANTWEYETITIAGDTTGTWVGATNGNGLQLNFSMGAGSSRIGTAGAWAAAGYYGATGQVNLVATNAATWQVTGVQLEAGTTASPFEYRQYGTELLLCMRYFQLMGSGGACGTAESATRVSMTYVFPVPMRASATGTLNAANGTLNQPQGGPNTVTSTNNFFFAGVGGTYTTGGWLVFDVPSNTWTTGRVIISNGSQGMVQFSAEL